MWLSSLSHSGATGASSITVRASLAIMRSLSRSCGKEILFRLEKESRRWPEPNWRPNAHFSRPREECARSAGISSGLVLARHDLECCGAGTCADHRAEV